MPAICTVAPTVWMFVICNTAAGGEPGAEALSGLAQSFLYAGARGLLVSLEQPLCGLDIRSAALEPPGHEKIDLSGKAQSSCCQHKPQVQVPK
mgnify:CR=1 FL=1